MENKDSIFAKLNPAPAPAQFQSTREPGPAPARAENDARVAGLEASVQALQSEVAALKQAASRPQPPPPPPPPSMPAKQDKDLILRLERSENGLLEFKTMFSEYRSQMKKHLEIMASKNEGSENGLLEFKTMFSEYRSRMEKYLEIIASKNEGSENGLLEFKTMFSEYRSQMKKYLEIIASKNEELAAVKMMSSENLSAFETMMKRTVNEELEGVKVMVSEKLAAFEAMRKRTVSEYTAEFSGIERECRKSLGEVRGYLENVAQKLVAERFDDYLKDSVARLSGKVADVEKAMHTGLADLSSRLMSDEVLYGKIFVESEDRLRKGLEPDMQAVNGQLKSLREKLTWLTEEYSIVMERKMRALEVKYSAFDVISARMDTINEAMRSENDSGAEKRKH